MAARPSLRPWRKTPGSAAWRALFFQQAAQHGDDEGGADAVAHHVADQHADAVVCDLDDLEEIPGEAGDRDVARAEADVVAGVGDIAGNPCR